MSEFMTTFRFVLFPFWVMCACAAILPATGSALYIRSEMMLAIALPPLSAAALTLGVMLGLPPENHGVLFVFSFLCTFAVVSWLGNHRLSEIKRQIVQASLFAGGNACTHLLMSISPRAHAHLGFLLTGELLSLGRGELYESAALCATAIGLFVFFKNAVLSYCIDEECMRLRTVHFGFFSILYRFMITLVISASVLFIGPLLTPALLILPVVFADSGRNSIMEFFLYATIIGIAGSAAGFLLGVAADLPPAYTAAIGILFLGIALKTARIFAPRRPPVPPIRSAEPPPISSTG